MQTCIFHTDQTGVIALWWFGFGAKLQHDVYSTGLDVAICSVFMKLLQILLSCNDSVLLLICARGVCVCFDFSIKALVCMHIFWICTAFDRENSGLVLIATSFPCFSFIHLLPVLFRMSPFCVLHFHSVYQPLF